MIGGQEERRRQQLAAKQAEERAVRVLEKTKKKQAFILNHLVRCYLCAGERGEHGGAFGEARVRTMRHCDCDAPLSRLASSHCEPRLDGRSLPTLLLDLLLSL